MEGDLSGRHTSASGKIGVKSREHTRRLEDVMNVCDGSEERRSVYADAALTRADSNQERKELVGGRTDRSKQPPFRIP